MNLLVQGESFPGLPSYPVLHLQSLFLKRPLWGWMESFGHSVQDLANPTNDLYVDTGQAEIRAYNIRIYAHLLVFIRGTLKYIKPTYTFPIFNCVKITKKIFENMELE